ncbi:hypothetical protein IEQ34_016585 [Dendrobium chrysotoxum]|uniref:RING-type domain-containing protein n=1 Tax=Dendrobium chrysotoxum TaxID=161865 RepID=A0AAV7GDW3_DENCH|nr:hypothetical protein IEQ34_016585 [Dendrobium chrysotoxum]
MSDAILITVAILFLISFITFMSYLFCSRSNASPPLQPEHNIEIELNDTTLTTWPMLRYVEAKRQDPRAATADCCSICLVNYDDEEEDKTLRLLSECGHLFHAMCVDPWLRQQWTCPMCRSSVIYGAMQM